jgi:hypothetical protein
MILSLFPNYANAATSDYKEYGNNPEKTLYKNIDPQKNKDSFIYDQKFDLSEYDLETLLSNTTINGSPLTLELYDSTQHVINNVSVVPGDSHFKFANNSQVVLVSNNVIFASIGYRASNGDSYAGLVPLRIARDDTSAGSNYEIASIQNIPMFKTAKDYWGSANDKPVGTPAITPDGTRMLYAVSQWVIQYNLQSDGSINDFTGRELAIVGTDIRQSIGGGPVYSPESGLMYFGSWNGQFYGINPYNIWDAPLRLNTRDFGGLGSPESSVMNNNTRIAAEPTIVQSPEGSRVLFGIGTNNGVKNIAGGFCSARLDLTDVRCSIGNHYYEFDDNLNASSVTNLSSGVDTVVDSSAAWSIQYHYAFGHDRNGVIYALDAYAKIRYKDTTLDGSIAYGGVSIQEDGKYGYIKINSLKDSSFGSDVYTTNSCIPGRLFRIDLNQMVYQMTLTNNVYVENYGFNVRANGALGNPVNGLYSHGDWKAGSEYVGHPFIMGETVLASTTGCGGVASSLFGANIMLHTSDNGNKNGDIEENKAVRDNISSVNPGRIDLVKDVRGTDYVSVDGMGKFAGPVGGVTFNPNYEDAIVSLTAKGIVVLYRQNGDFVITDLSMLPPTGGDGKYYQITNNDPDPKIYQGHVRVATSQLKNMYIPSDVNLSNLTVTVKVFQTTMPTSDHNNIYNCPDNNTTHGDNTTLPCAFDSGASVDPNYQDPNFLMQHAKPKGNYSDYYREMYSKDIPLQSLLKPGPNGSHILIPNTELLDANFDVFKNAFTTNPTETWHRLIAYVDVHNSIPTEDKSNNMGYITFKYEGAPKPDLAIQCELENPSTGDFLPNQTYRINMTATNLDDKGKAFNPFNYVFKKDGVVANSGTIDKSEFGPDGSLQKGETVTRTVTYSFGTSGGHNLNLEINTDQDSGLTPEVTYVNNSCDFNINIRGSDWKPDLQAVTVGTSDTTYKFKYSGSTVIDGTDVVIRGVVQNVGEQRIDINTNTYVKVQRYGSTITEVFAPCKSYVPSLSTCQINVTLPRSTLQPGDYSITMKADYGYGLYDNGVLVEKSEYNNIATGYFTIKADNYTTGYNYFSPNGGGIRDTAPMIIYPYIDNFTVDYKIGIYNSSGNMIRTLVSKSTPFRFPNVWQNPNWVCSQYCYYNNYYHYYDAVNDWNNLPKTNGYYMWDGKDNSGNVVPDGTYNLGYTYTYERTNIKRIYLWDTCGGWYYSYPCLRWHPEYDYYLPNSYYTNRSYGTQVVVDNHLDLNNVEIQPNHVRASEYLKIPSNITTSLEADEVTVSIPADLIITDKLTNSRWERNGDKIIIWLVPQYSTSGGSDAGYRENQTYRCNNDAYCNKWGLANGDSIVIAPFAKSGDHVVRFTAKTRLDTPDSPVYKDVNIRIEGAIYDEIRVREQFK